MVLTASQRGCTINTIDCMYSVLADSQRGCTIYTIVCMYSKLPPEDEQLIYSKHVDDIIGINLKRKCISLVLITKNVHDARSI